MTRKPSVPPEPRLRPALRDELASIGIPRENQTLSGLSGYFPPEFEIEKAHFDLDTLAAVLIHLVKRRLIKLP